jgi:hypothetical protein
VLEKQRHRARSLSVRWIGFGDLVGAAFVRRSDRWPVRAGAYRHTMNAPREFADDLQGCHGHSADTSIFEMAALLAKLLILWRATVDEDGHYVFAVPL